MIIKCKVRKIANPLGGHRMFTETVGRGSSIIQIPEYEALVTAIIQRAVDDYKYCIAHMWEDTLAWISKPNQKEVEAFFRSDWFNELTGLNGEKFMQMIRKEVGVE